MDGIAEGVTPCASHLLHHIPFFFTSKPEDLHHKFQQAYKRPLILRMAQQGLS